MEVGIWSGADPANAAPLTQSATPVTSADRHARMKSPLLLCEEKCGPVPAIRQAKPVRRSAGAVHVLLSRVSGPAAGCSGLPQDFGGVPGEIGQYPAGSRALEGHEAFQNHALAIQPAAP